MELPLYREYKYKFYLNAKHYIVINDKKGETHPHTWEIQIHFGIPRTVFIQFTKIEKAINDCIDKYQDKVLNDHEPFDGLVPTVENMTDVFAKSIGEVVESFGGAFYSIEVAETPTRITRLSFGNRNTNESSIDSIIDEIVRKHG
ncbi:MAG: 6-carboxytetrahydropterin synthase [Erysipelotrichaceae bacterium]|nr:6-carboxytetrahydropterin synthase [Erysipelotrichaceae bacterium]